MTTYKQQQAAFDWKAERRKQLAKFFALQERFAAEQRESQAMEGVGAETESSQALASAGIYYVLHKRLHSIEYMVTLEPQRDLAAGTPRTGRPEDRARQFLLNNWTLFSFLDGNDNKDRNFRQFNARLFLKHLLRSRLGTHCVFGWRINGIETDESFVVHLDDDNQVVMVSATYNNERIATGSIATPELDTSQLDNVFAKTCLQGTKLAAGGSSAEAGATNNDAQDYAEALKTKVEAWLKTSRVAGAVQIDPIIATDTEGQIGGGRVPALQVKGTFLALPTDLKLDQWSSATLPTRDLTLVFALDRTLENGSPGWKLVQLAEIPGGIAAGRLGLAYVYDGFWQFTDEPQAAPDDEAALLAEPLKLPETPLYLQDEVERQKSHRTVILRDLDSNSELVGRYVRVSDYVSPSKFATRSYNFLSKSSPLSTEFDRQMAYYHIDLIQRYFRRLGLDLLDDYGELNPLDVVIEVGKRTEYSSNTKRVTIAQVAGDYTHARDARILYHEFVHAVTDCLARLNRHADNNVNNPRYPQMFQAAAMDEGLADYFACSLAAQNGAPNAHFYVLLANESNENAPLKVSNRRCLGATRELNYKPYDYDLSLLGQLNAQPTNEVERLRIATEEQPDVYRWGEQWSRYLWHLRYKLGCEVADTIIAHSILFLSRYATFSLGVLALALADQLLFEGKNKATILELAKAKGVGEWDAPVDPVDGELPLRDDEISQLRKLRELDADVLRELPFAALRNIPLDLNTQLQQLREAMGLDVSSSNTPASSSVRANENIESINIVGVVGLGTAMPVFTDVVNQAIKRFSSEEEISARKLVEALLDSNTQYPQFATKLAAGLQPRSDQQGNKLLPVTAWVEEATRQFDLTLVKEFDEALLIYGLMLTDQDLLQSMQEDYRSAVQQALPDEVLRRWIEARHGVPVEQLQRQSAAQG